MSAYEPVELIPADEEDPRVQAAIDELCNLILARYPEATFTTYYGEDTDLIWLEAAVGVEDLDEVVNVILDRMVDMQEAGLPVSVVPTWPEDRIADHLRNMKRSPIEQLLPIG